MGGVHHHWVTLFPICFLLWPTNHLEVVSLLQVSQKEELLFIQTQFYSLWAQNVVCVASTPPRLRLSICRRAPWRRGGWLSQFWAPTGLPSGSPILLTEGASGAAALWLSSASALFPTPCAHPLSAVVWMCLLHRPPLLWAVFPAYWLFLWRQHVTASKEKNPIAEVVSRWVCLCMLCMSAVLLTQAGNFRACVLQFWPASAAPSLSHLCPLFLGEDFQFLFLPVWEVCNLLLFFQWQLLNF